MNWLFVAFAALFVWCGVNTVQIFAHDGNRSLPPLAERINSACGPKGHPYDWSGYSPGSLDPLPRGTIQVTCDSNNLKEYKRWYVAVATEVDGQDPKR